MSGINAVCWDGENCITLEQTFGGSLKTKD